MPHLDSQGGSYEGEGILMSYKKALWISRVQALEDKITQPQRVNWEFILVPQSIETQEFPHTLKEWHRKRSSLGSRVRSGVAN